ncbi:LysR family transcriptional regulator [Enterococcus sp. LJL51]|uniref:LysR family transcriptional regulator n=1 Tax=Enterococcus sp. LJL51 TaxID=3416656 RepID=UPI003CFB0F65
MNLRHLEYFIALAESEHMRLTAEQLNTSQPNISHAISMLEEELGAKLFEKKGRNIYLTRYGKLFYQHAVSGLQQLYTGKRLIQEMVDPQTGHIQLGFIYTMGSILAPQLTKDFLSIEENHKIQFNFSQGNSLDILELLKIDEIDIAICSKVAEDPSIQFNRLVQQEIVVVVPNKHPLADKDEVSLKVLTQEAFIYYNKQSGIRPYIDEVLAAQQIKPKIVFEAEEDHSILGFVGCDYGIAIMPDIPSISAYPVKKLQISDTLLPRYIYLATKKDRKMTPAVQRFYDYCQQSAQYLIEN